MSFLPVLIAISIASFAVGFYFLKSASGPKTNQKIDTKKIDESHKIFSLISALRFMGIYLVINVSSKIAIELFGSSGFLVTSAIGSLTGIDAVVINTAQLAGNRIDLTLGVWALVMANGVNLIAKSVYSFIQGSREFALKYLISMLIIIGVSIASAVLF